MLTSALLFICILLTAAGANKKKHSKNKPKQGIIIARVSTAEQTKGTSLETQVEFGMQKSRKDNVAIVKVIKIDMSGKLFPKQYYDEILDIVKKKKITHVYVYSFDRLSRSFPSGVRLANSLFEQDVKIITSTLSPDHTKHTNRVQVWMSLLFAEMAHGGIIETTRLGMIHKLEHGIYPRKKPPYGFERIDLKLQLKSGYKQVIEDIFKTYTEAASYAKTSRIINRKYKGQLDVPLTGSKVNQIINNQIYSGFYHYDGLLFGENGENDAPRQEMQAIDKKTFDAAQKIANKKRNGHSQGDDILNHSIEKWVEKYGPGYIVDHMDCLTWRCPRCHSTDLSMNGSQVRNGSAYKLLYCNKCTHHFRISTALPISNFTSLQPRRCMKCGTVDNFIVEDSQLSEYYRVVCKECGFESLVRKNETVFRR